MPKSDYTEQQLKELRIKAFIYNKTGINIQTLLSTPLGEASIYQFWNRALIQCAQNEGRAIGYIVGQIELGNIRDSLNLTYAMWVIYNKSEEDFQRLFGNEFQQHELNRTVRIASVK